jgi:hypothetical protein
MIHPIQHAKFMAEELESDPIAAAQIADHIPVARLQELLGLPIMKDADTGWMTRLRNILNEEGFGRSRVDRILERLGG